MTALADVLIPTPSFLDDLTPESGLAERRWSLEEFQGMAYPVLFGPDERVDLAEGKIVERGTGVPRPFSRDEYYRLGELSILGPEERTELIYGRIIKRMSPMGRPHSVAVLKTTDALSAAFGAGFAVEPQMSLKLGNGLEVQPDVMVLPGASDDYADVPLAPDVLLLVEISDSTLRYDRKTKATLYAENGIADYWLINLRARTLEVHRQPENGDYISLDVYGEAESVAPLATPNVPVRVSDLLPLVPPRSE